MLGMGSQVGLRKYHYDQSQWRWWHSCWAISNPEYDALNVLHLICQQIWKTQQWPQDWKRSIFIPVPKKGSPKECSNYRTIALISHTSKVILKILQVRRQQYVNHELPDVPADFRKGRGTRDQIATIHWIIKKGRKASISALLTMPKPLTVWITIKCGKFWKRWEYQMTWPVCRSGSNS